MLAVASRNIMACRDTLAAGLAMRRAGSVSSSVASGAPAGVSVRTYEGHAHQVTRIDPLSMPALHIEALDLAWGDGAWDVQFLRHPPLSEQDLGNVSANHVYEDPALLAALLDAGAKGRLCTWSWRPMRFAPMVRSAAHHARDVTLDLDGGRRGARPVMRTINWAGQGGCEVIIRMGMAKLAATPVPRYGPMARASGQQRRYIVDLRRRAGIINAALPATTTQAEASAIIDALLAGLQGS